MTTNVTEWRAVLGYEGVYEVSNDGRVRVLGRTDTIGRPLPSGEVQTWLGRGGYPCIKLRTNGKKANRMVHHLVLEAFVAPRPDGMVACHNNGDPADNRPENLRWDTQSANRLDTVRHGNDANATKGTCPSGHVYTEENTYRWVRDGATKRFCRACARESNRRRSNRNRAETVAR